MDSILLSHDGHSLDLLHERRIADRSFFVQTDRTLLQAQVEGLTSHFVQETANPVTLSAILAGGLAFRLGRVGTLALGEGHVVAMPLRLFSYGVGLGSEVTAFEFTHRALQPVTRHLSPHLWSWSGPGGWREGLATSALTFGMLRGTGFFARDQNLVFQHLFQDTTMVAGHQLTARLGITPPPEGNWAEQFLHAEAMNLQMMAGMGMVQGVLPELSGFERGLDLSLERREAGAPLGEPLLVRSEAIETVGSPHVSMMTMGEFFGWRTGGRKSDPVSETPPASSPDPSGRGRSSNPPNPRFHGYFQSLYNAEEAFGLERILEGQTVVHGRESRVNPGLFPGHYRNISRQHLSVRFREGRLEIRPHPASQGIRLNHQEISFFHWTTLRHGDLVEFVSESRQDLENLEGKAADPNWPSREGDRPALFRFLDPTLPHFPLPRANQLPSPETLPLPLLEAQVELNRFSQMVDGVVHLSSQALRQFSGILQQNPVGAARDLIKAHRHFCGGAVRHRAVEVAKQPTGESVVLNIEVPHWEGILSERIKIFEATLLHDPSVDSRSPLVLGARQKLNQVRDQLGRLQDIVKTYRQFLNTPVALTLLDAVELAYVDLGRESYVRMERVRSLSRSLNITVHEEERQQWLGEFLQGVIEPRVRRNVQILMGLLPTVFGEPVGGSFYRAVSMGTLYEGLRSVRGLFDTETGELVAFRDESPQYLETVGHLRQQGRELEEVSFLVDVVSSGQIVEVAVLDRKVRESVRDGLEGLRGLQVLPRNEPTSTTQAGETIYTIHGTTERGDPVGEVWQMSYPFDPNTPTKELRQVVAVTPFQESAGADGVPRYSLVTLEPQVPEEGVAAIQLWVPHQLVQGWEAGAVVRVTRRQ